jgi:DNA-binding protein
MAEKKEPKVQAKPKEVKELKEVKVAKEAPKVQAKVAKETPVAKTSAPQGSYVYIGKKGAMAYVLAVVTQFGMGANEVIIKARGKSISRAVDVAEIIKNKDNTMKVVSINTATEEVVTQDGRPLKVSSIEIVIGKN